MSSWLCQDMSSMFKPLQASPHQNHWAFEPNQFFSKKNWGPAAPKGRRLGRIAHQLSLLFSEGLQATGTIWNTGRIRAAGWVEDNLISHLGLFYGYSTSKRWYLVNLCWKSAKHSQTINHPGNKRGFLLSFGIYRLDYKYDQMISNPNFWQVKHCELLHFSWASQPQPPTHPPIAPSWRRATRQKHRLFGRSWSGMVGSSPHFSQVFSQPPKHLLVKRQKPPKIPPIVSWFTLLKNHHFIVKLGMVLPTLAAISTFRISW